MKHKKYSDEFKQQVVDECREVGNASLVARCYQVSKHTAYSWLRKARENGSVKSLPQSKEEKYPTVVDRLEKLSEENDMLKKLLAEKELVD